MLVKEPQLVIRYKHILALLMKYNEETKGHEKTDKARWDFLLSGLEFRVTLKSYKDPYIFVIKLPCNVIFLHEDGVRREKNSIKNSPLNHPVFGLDDLTQICEDNKNIILSKFKKHRFKNKKFQTVDLYDL